MRLARRLPGRSLALALVGVFAAACGQKHPVESGLQDLVGAPAEIVVMSEGGIATLRVIVRLDSATGALTRATCRLMIPAEACGTEGHLEQVTLTSQQIESIFGVTRTAEFRALKGNYGRSTQGADMMDHSIVVTANDQLRTIKGDDITLPPAVGKLTSALNTPLQK